MYKDRGGCVCHTTRSLLQSVLKLNYKTGMSKDDDCSLLVSVSNFRNLAVIQ